MSVSLIIGASGQVGSHVLAEGRRRGLTMVGTYYAHEVSGLLPLDIRDSQAVRHLLNAVRPTVIYLPAAFVNVDVCEQQPRETFQTNVAGVAHVIQAANEVGARLVFFSSDYIFDGAAGPYREDDIPNPLSEYGRQKLIAEHMIALQARQPYLIIRTTVIYAWEAGGRNFIARLLRSLEAGEPVSVSEDQFGNATYAPNLARAVVELALQEAQGVFHVCGPKRSSRYAFAVAAARIFKLNEQLIMPVSTDVLKQSARRPLQAGMVVDRVEARLPFSLMSYQEGLQAMLAERVVSHAR